jgi:hypothetical protein
MTESVNPSDTPIWWQAWDDGNQDALKATVSRQVFTFLDTEVC